MRQSWWRVVSRGVYDLKIFRVIHQDYLWDLWITWTTMISWMTALSNFDNLASSKQGSPLTKCTCLSKGLLHISKMIIFPAPQPLSPNKLSQPTDMMEWLQRLRSAKSSPGPGASTPIDDNKSVEKNMLWAKKSPPWSEISPFSQPKASVAAMKITRSLFLEYFLQAEGYIQVLLGYSL